MKALIIVLSALLFSACSSGGKFKESGDVGKLKNGRRIAVIVFLGSSTDDRLQEAYDKYVDGLVSGGYAVIGKKSVLLAKAYKACTQRALPQLMQMPAQMRNCDPAKEVEMAEVARELKVDHLIFATVEHKLDGGRGHSIGKLVVYDRGGDEIAQVEVQGVSESTIEEKASALKMRTAFREADAAASKTLAAKLKP